MDFAAERRRQFGAHRDHRVVVAADFAQQRIRFGGNALQQFVDVAQRGRAREPERRTGLLEHAAREVRVAPHAGHRPREFGEIRPAALRAVGRGFVHAVAQQVVVRRQREAAVGDEEAQVLQVRIAVADHDAEHQPAEDPQPRA